MKAVCIKLGGSLITDKAVPRHARMEHIEAIATEIANIYNNHPNTVFFIGNGAGSFGHFAVHETRWREKKDDPMRIAKIRQVTTELHFLIRDALIAHGVPALSFAATSFSGRYDKQPKAWLESMFSHAANGVVPLVFGDIVYDDTDGSYVLSTEEILEIIAKSWIKAGHSIDTFIYCTSVDGVLDETGRVIPRIDKHAVINSIGKTHGFDVTGGMAQKIEAGKRALTFTDYVYIINGSKPGQLSKAINHQIVGTRISV